MRKNKFIFAFLMSTGGITLMLAVQMRARDLGAPAWWLGVQAAASLLMYGVGNTFVGRLIRRVRRRTLLLAGPLLAMLATVLLWMISDYRLFPAVMALNGFAGSLFWAPLEVTIAEETHPGHLPRSLGLFNLSWTSAFVLGPLLCGALYESNPSGPFVFVLVVQAVLIAFVAGTHFTPRALSPDEKDTHAAGVPADVAVMHRRLAWVAIFAQGFLSFALIALIPKVTQINHFPDLVPGLMISLRGAALFVTFFVLARWRRWHYRAGGLVAAQLAGAAAVLVIAFCSESLLLLALAFPVTGFAYACCYNASIFYSVSDHRAREVHSARHELLVASGPIFGPPVVGAVATVTGSYALSFSICAVVILVAVAIQIAILHATAKMKSSDDAS